MTDRTINWVFRATDKTQAAFRSVDSRLAGIGKSLQSFARFTGFAAVAAGLGTLTKELISLGSELNDMSARLGISVEKLQGLKLGAEETGGSFEQLQAAVAFLTRLTGNAVAGNAGAIKSFDRLGLSVDNFAKLSNDRRLAVIAEVLKNAGTPTKQLELALLALGRGAAGLVPLFKGGADVLDEYQRKAEAMVIITTEQSKILDDAEDDWKRFWTGVKVGAVPALTAFIGFARGVAKEWGNVSELLGQGFAFPGAIPVDIVEPLDKGPVNPRRSSGGLTSSERSVIIKAGEAAKAAEEAEKAAKDAEKARVKAATDAAREIEAIFKRTQTAQETYGDSLKRLGVLQKDYGLGASTAARETLLLAEAYAKAGAEADFANPDLTPIQAYLKGLERVSELQSTAGQSAEVSARQVLELSEAFDKARTAQLDTPVAPPLDAYVAGLQEVVRKQEAAGESAITLAGKIEGIQGVNPFKAYRDGLDEIAEINPFLAYNEGLAGISQVNPFRSYMEGLDEVQKVNPFSAYNEGLASISDDDPFSIYKEGLASIVGVNPFSAYNEGLESISEANPFESYIKGLEGITTLDPFEVYKDSLASISGVDPFETYKAGLADVLAVDPFAAYKTGLLSLSNANPFAGFQAALEGLSAINPFEGYERGLESIADVNPFEAYTLGMKAIADEQARLGGPTDATRQATDLLQKAYAKLVTQLYLAGDAGRNYAGSFGPIVTGSDQARESATQLNDELAVLIGGYKTVQEQQEALDAIDPFAKYNAALEAIDALEKQGRTTADSAAKARLLAGQSYANEADQMFRASEAGKEYVRLHEDAKNSLADAVTPTEAYTAALEKLNRQLAIGAVTPEEFAKLRKAEADTYIAAQERMKEGNAGFKDSTKEMYESLKLAADGFARDLTDVFFDSTNSIGDMFKKLAETIAKALFTSLVTEPLIQGILGSFGTQPINLNSLPPRRAAGGPVGAGGSYIVGEKGPELFVPNSSGTIIPNGARMGSGESPVNINMTITSVDPQTAAQTIAAQERLITGMVRRATLRAGRRPALA